MNDISCKLSQMETIGMKSQIKFPAKNKKKITTLSSAELAQRVVKVGFFFHRIHTLEKKKSLNSQAHF